MRNFAGILVATLVFLSVSSPVAMASSICDELWFTRNWVMDQAGYCFGSTLGQALFDNADCSGQQVALSPAQSAFIADIQHREATLGCSVDTGRSTLDMSAPALRMRLEQQPVPHVGDNMEGWGCLGYTGTHVVLHAAPNLASAPVGRVVPGDWISVGRHQSVDGWTYVTTYGPSWGAFRSGGWMRMGIAISCEIEAG